jgi:cytoskeletal protein CcmA (bactofilin family)
MADDQFNQDQNDDVASLEQPTSPDGSSNEPSISTSNIISSSNTPQFKGFILHTLSGFNIYLLFFFLLLIIAGIIGAILYFRAESNANSNLASQSLSQNVLDQLATTDVTVGAPKHTLNVQSNAVFTGSVLVRSDLEIAGNLQVGNSLAIAGLRVTGNSTFDDVQITKSLALTGNESVQGQVNVQGPLNVNGTGSFQGAISAPSLTVGSLQLSGPLSLSSHISGGGSTPSRTYDSGLGSGGSASINGSDTTGTVTINTGGNPAAGCYVTINFTTHFNSTPHIVITPVGSAAAGINYYINRSTSNFSVCSLSSPAPSTTLAFDYIAFD